MPRKENRMPRDSGGLYTLPGGTSVADGTVIQAAWANTLTTDLAVQLNNVLTKDGLIGPGQPFLLPNGTSAAPALAFAAQVNLGLFRESANILGIASNLITVARFSNLGIDFLKPVGLQGDLTMTGNINLTGNITASGTFTPAGNTKLPNGTVAAPALYFAADAGWYVPAPNVFGRAALGVSVDILDYSVPGVISQNYYPRAAGGAGVLSLWSNPTLHATKTRFEFKVDTVATMTAIGPNGTTDRINFKQYASQYEWFVTATEKLLYETNGKLTSKMFAIDANSIWYQDATNVLFSMAPTWYWAFEKSTGKLSWVRNNGTNPTTFFAADGDFLSGKDIYTGTATATSTLALITNPGFPYLRFSTPVGGAGWRFMFNTATNVLGYYSSAGVMQFASDGATGHFQIRGNYSGFAMTLIDALYVGTNINATGNISTSASGNIVSGAGFIATTGYTFTAPNAGTSFGPGGVTINPGTYSASGNMRYVNALTATPLGMAMTISYQHESGVWAAMQLQVGGAPFSFRNTNEAEKAGGQIYWIIPSDRELKHDIRDFDIGLEAIERIKVHRYRYNSTPEKENFGIISDEMKKIMPMTIERAYKGYDQFGAEAVFWAAINAIKELSKRVNKLEKVH